MRIQFLTSAVDPTGYPPEDRPEILLVGRSNSGKSSLINAIAADKVAKVSQMPGKTRLLNFFNVGENYRFVDVPGYGFSSRSGDEQRSWQKMIEDYMFMRRNLTGLVLIMDVRRPWTPDEESLAKWCRDRQKPWILLLNKSDKLSRSERMKKMNLFHKTAQAPCFAVSAFKNDGVLEVEKFIFQNWVKPFKGVYA